MKIQEMRQDLIRGMGMVRNQPSSYSDVGVGEYGSGCCLLGTIGVGANLSKRRVLHPEDLVSGPDLREKISIKYEVPVMLVHTLEDFYMNRSVASERLKDLRLSSFDLFFVLAEGEQESDVEEEDEDVEKVEEVEEPEPALV